MAGKQHLRAIADPEVAAHLDAGRFQHLDFAEQRAGIDDQPVADDRLFSRPQNAAGNELEDELLIADAHRMAGVMAALVARHDIEVRGEQIDDLPLAFVAPLGAQDDNISHGNQTRIIVPHGTPAKPSRH